MKKLVTLVLMVSGLVVLMSAGGGSIPTTVATPTPTDGGNSSNGANGSNGVSMQWLGQFASAPSNPPVNGAYYNTTDRKSYVWYNSTWNIVATDGVTGPSGPQGPQGVASLTNLYRGIGLLLILLLVIGVLLVREP